ncbi:phosphate propanoyltransferase [Candidatus Saccharibacteria bacterium]|nr:phosphate propanoyltransferase [Candidatus Saccharibacteria bacterium]
MPNRIIVEVSARHVHLCRKDLDVLFGEGYELTPEKPLSQPGEFVSTERLSIAGPREMLHNVAILGPLRPKTQVEITLTEARKIGVKPPIRESGHLEGSASCRLIGPKGEVELEEGVIVAKRHLHLSEKDALELGVKNGDIVSVKINSTERGTVFGDVVARVSDKYACTMHLDTDEGNAAGVLSGITTGEIL